MADLIENGLHGCSREEDYVIPELPLIRERLEWFRDQKLALMMHFGPYSQLGMCESWPLSEEDSVWSRTGLDWEKDPAEFRRQYIGLNRSFNPVRIEPEKWAEMAKRNGFRYLIFTTKHHDGFCMFDTALTDYKVTAEDCAFHTHKHANIAKDVFDAFREKDIAIAAYFSKPDWNCPWYWADGMEQPIAATRNPTYNPAEHPELWEKFVQFTHGQIMELMSDYGRIDILWLDGGQVNPANGQDIRLSEVVAKARELQPHLITADRTIGGPNENYITPEQSVPTTPITVPWESCVSVGTGFAYKFDDQYKSAKTLIHMLIDVVSRGGNLALNIAPQPDGRLPRPAIESANGLGDWLAANGDAIYGTRICPPYQIGSTAFTRKGDTVYAIRKMNEGEKLESTLLIPWTGDAACVTSLELGTPLPFTRTDEGLVVALPYALVGTSPIAPAFRID